MAWKIIEKRIGRAGGIKQRTARQRKWDQMYAEATTGVDLQVPAIMSYLERNNLQLQGNEVVDIGSWKGQRSHPISIRLSPLHIHVVGNPKMTLEQYWQDEKCLAIWERDEI